MRITHLAVLSTFVLTFSLAGRADTLRLRDGRVMTGQFLGANRYEIRFQQDGVGLQRLDINTVDSVSFSGNDSAYAPGFNSNRAYGYPPPPSASSPAYAPNWPNNSRSYTAPPSSYAPAAPNAGPNNQQSYTGPPPSYPPAAPNARPAGVVSPSDYLLPAGTVVVVRLIDPVKSDVSQVGATYHGNLDQPIVVNGRIIIPAGADATLQVVHINSGNPLAGREEIGIALASVTSDGRTFNLDTNTEAVASPDNRGRRSAETIGGGAILGAIVGGIAGGGPGAAIGAGVGAAAGTGAAVLRGHEVKIPAETRLSFTLTRDVQL